MTTKFDELVAKLKEIFQIDKPELDKLAASDDSESLVYAHPFDMPMEFLMKLTHPSRLEQVTD